MNTTNNHFPCNCQIVSWLNSALFANQSRDRVMSNNFCISPYEVHGKSIQSAAEDFHMLDSCEPDDADEEVDDADSPELPPLETGPLETTAPSTLLSSRASSAISSRWQFNPAVVGFLVLLFCTV